MGQQDVFSWHALSYASRVYTPIDIEILQLLHTLYLYTYLKGDLGMCIHIYSPETKMYRTCISFLSLVYL